jgi:hypothetical protein
MSVATVVESAPPIITWLTSVGATGVLAAAVIGFVRGWIVSPGRLADAQRARDEWRDIATQERAARQQSETTSDAVLEQLRVTNRLLEELRKRAG